MWELRGNIVLLLICCLATVWTAEQGDKKRTHPPRIVRDPPKEIAYKVNDKVGGGLHLPCVASAEPEATYRWEKDGEPLIITGTDIKKQPGSGTLVIEEPSLHHEGVYQCFASNHFGTALSVKTMLKRAVLEPFDTVAEVKEHKVDVGDPLTLRCRPPKNYPSGSVYWGETTPENKFKPLTNNARVSQDYDGNLYYANVVETDSHGGISLVCVVYNHIIRSLVQGDDTQIVPRPGPATPDYQAPSLMWASDTPTTAITGTTKTMKCIFSGYPTPTVKWIRLDAPMLDKNEETSFGQELTVHNVVFEDGGEYQCVATNMERGEEVTKDFHLNVESMPFWVKEPEDVNSAEEENAEFHCEAGGKPKPKVTWSMNGKPLAEATPDSRRVLRDGVLSFTNLTKTDAQVLQCNSSNKHGYIFANAYLNVAADPPTWVQAPKGVVVSAEGQAVNLTCRVYGAPKPVITWTYEGYPINETKRFSVTKDGDLHINYLYDSDQGSYQCHAANKFGDIMGAGSLRVKGQTEITTAPITQTVNASTTVIFYCEATTDLTELKNLEYKWKFNKFDVLDLEDNRISQNTREHSLQIMGATVRDTGDYTCVAQNSIDSDEATARLVVQDKPESPVSPKLRSCTAARGEVEWGWRSEMDNNNEIIDFVVSYNTSFDEPGKYHKGPTVPAGTYNSRVELSPWTNYTFHVRARNSLGTSEPSKQTPGLCRTLSSIPYRNPKDVCTESRGENKLVIMWEPMQQIDHNGEGFYYLVSYKENKKSDAVEVEKKIYKWEQRELVVPNVETFQEYLIYVRAVNDEGPSPESKLKKKIGWSGEAVPLDSPTDFAIDEGSLNATSATFNWTRVEETPDRIRGHFKGYQIQFWKTDDPDNVRTHDLVLGSVEACRDAPRGHRGRNKRATDEVAVAHVNNLWPFSKITAGVLAQNGAKSGALSPTLEFETPEGVPGILPMFEVRETGSHHLGVSWVPPLEPNGIVIGYTIGYQRADNLVEPMEIFSVDVTRRDAKIKKLEPETQYRLYIWAFTGEGKGVEQVAEATTTKGVPDVPGFANVDIGENSVNVSWVPTGEGPTKNPGSEFYVEYRKKKKVPTATLR